MKYRAKYLFFVIYSPFPSFAGGRETWLSHIFSKLSDHGYSVTIISLYHARKPSRPFYKLDDRVQLVNIFTPRSLVMFSIPILVELDMLLFTFVASLYLLFKAPRSSIVYCMNPGFETLGPLFLKRLRRKIIIISTIRGLWSWEMSFRYQRLKPIFISSLFKKVLRFIEYYTLKNADIVIANGYDTAEKYSILIGRFIYILPNGVDTTEFTPQSSTSTKQAKTILTVTNLRALAGINALIKSVVYLKQIYHKPFKVKIVGGGDKRPFLKLAETLGVKQYIEFLGERQDIPNLLREADVVACLKEGGGISHSLLEAMASGKAIVAWNTRVYNQVLTNGFNGLLVAKDDIKQLSEAFSKLLNDHEFAVVLGRNARAEAMKYDWNEIAKMLIKILSGKLQQK